MKKESQEFHFHKPPLWKRLAEKIGLIQITPTDILSTQEADIFLRTHRSAAGDQDIGMSDLTGGCQDYNDVKQWWEKYTDNKNQ